MKLYVGSDHAGFELKNQLMAAFPDLDWQDIGTFTTDSVDYPDYAQKVCEKITEVENQNKSKGLRDSFQGEALGVLICGSGQGMAIKANRYPQIRAALCWTNEVAQVSREHNNANILCMGSRFISLDLAKSMLKTFLATPFAGGRHQQRVDKLC